MEENKLSPAELIQAVINTLQLLEMAPTYNNSNRMTGIYNYLAKVRNYLIEQESKPKEETSNAGETDAE